MEQPAALRVEEGGITAKTRPAETLAIMSQKPAQDGQTTSISGSFKAVSKSQVWDCGSSLYDSFELDSFNRQLDSAIKASYRSLSMPHLPEPVPGLPATRITKHQTLLPDKSSNFSKSLKKILKSVFGSSSTNLNIATNHPSFKHKSSTEILHKDSFSFHDGSKSMRVLKTIPEMQVFDGLAMFSPEATPAVRRAASHRLTSATVCVSCGSR